MFFPFWDPSFLIVLPALALAIYAQFKVRSTYQRMSRVQSACGRTGREVAELILQSNGISGVTVNRAGGVLSDNFDPRSRTVNLSEDIHDGKSLASLAIAAHEVGHVIQHHRGYAPVGMRDAILPAANIGTFLAFPLFFIGLIFHSGMSTVLMDLGIALFGMTVLFHVVTLPTEFDASNRAMHELTSRGLLSPDEAGMARKVLNAAALTYIAAAAMALLQLLRLVMIRNSRD